jgi:hypothetical protein
VATSKASGKRSVLKVGPRGGKIVGYLHGDPRHPIYEKPTEEGAARPRPDDETHPWVHDLDGATTIRGSHTVRVDRAPGAMHLVHVAHEDGTVLHHALTDVDSLEEAKAHGLTILGKIEKRKPSDDPRAPKPGDKLWATEHEVWVDVLKDGGYLVHIGRTASANVAFAGSLSEAAVLCMRAEGKKPAAVNGYAYFKLGAKETKAKEPDKPEEPKPKNETEKQRLAREATEESTRIARPVYEEYLRARADTADPRCPARALYQEWHREFRGNKYKLAMDRRRAEDENPGPPRWHVFRQTGGTGLWSDDWEAVSSADSISKVTADITGSATNGWKWWGIEYEPALGVHGVMRHMRVLEQRLGGLKPEDFGTKKLESLGEVERAALDAFGNEQEHRVPTVARAAISTVQFLHHALMGDHRTPDPDPHVAEAMQRLYNDPERWSALNRAYDKFHKASDRLRDPIRADLKPGVATLREAVQEYQSILESDPALAGLQVIRQGKASTLFAGKWATDQNREVLMGQRYWSDVQEQAGDIPRDWPMLHGIHQTSFGIGLDRHVRNAVMPRIHRTTEECQSGAPITAFQALQYAQALSDFAESGTRLNEIGPHLAAGQKAKDYFTTRWNRVHEAARKEGGRPMVPYLGAKNDEHTETLFGKYDRADEDLTSSQQWRRIAARTTYQMVELLADRNHGDRRETMMPRVAQCEAYKKNQRACFKISRELPHPVVEFAKDEHYSVVAHEFAHHLDYANHDLARTAQEWRNAYAMHHNDGKLELKTLNAQCKDRGYEGNFDAWEEGYVTKDHSLEMYVLKTYTGQHSTISEGSATEVLSMGVQHLAEQQTMETHDIARRMADPAYYEHMALVDLMLEHAFKKLDAQAAEEKAAKKGARRAKG